MPIAITPDETWDWQLPEDRTKEGMIDPEKTVFKLGALTVAEEAEVEDSLASMVIGEGSQGDVRWNKGTQTMKILRLGLRDIVNLFYKDGAAFKFVTKSGPNGRRRCDTDCLGVLSQLHRTLVSDAIIERQQITGGESDS